MFSKQIFTYLALSPVIGGVLAAVALAQPPNLPLELVAVRQQVIDLATANTTRRDNIAEVREQLDPLVQQLGDWFAANRPADEVQLTQVPWRNLWYDDPDISFDVDFVVFSFRLDRNQIYQVIEEGFYYNVSESVLRIFGREWRLQNYLKGAYQIIRASTDANQGEPRLNTVDLEFADNRLQYGRIPRFLTLSQLVQLVETYPWLTFQIPGPNGVTGELWNIYVDEELRIAAGFDDREPEIIDLYILRKSSRAGN